MKTKGAFVSNRFQKWMPDLFCVFCLIPVVWRQHNKLALGLDSVAITIVFHYNWSCLFLCRSCCQSVIYCAQVSQCNSQRLTGFAGFSVLDVAAPWQEAFSGWMQGTRACRSCQVRSEGCSAANFKPFYSHGKTAPSKPLRLWKNLLPPSAVSSWTLNVPRTCFAFSWSHAHCSTWGMTPNLGFIFWGTQLEEHPIESIRRGRPKNQAQDIFGVGYCLEENYPWGVMKNWGPETGQMGSEERRALLGGYKETETMNWTEKKALEWRVRAELEQGLERHKSRSHQD